MPTVRVYSPAPNEPCYLLCLNADGTPDATSPPYPTPQAAYHTLHQLGLLSAATTDRDIGHRATTQTTSNTCRCSPNGWRCEHIQVELPEAEPPDRGHGLSL